MRGFFLGILLLRDVMLFLLLGRPGGSCSSLLPLSLRWLRDTCPSLCFLSLRWFAGNIVVSRSSMVQRVGDTSNMFLLLLRGVCDSDCTVGPVSTQCAFDFFRLRFFLLRLLLPGAFSDAETLVSLSQEASANLLFAVALLKALPTFITRSFAAVKVQNK